MTSPTHRRLATGFLAAWLAATTALASFNLVMAAEPALSWLGLLLTTAAPLAMLALIQASRTRRGRLHPLGFTTMSGLGVAICMAMSWRHGQAAGIVHIFAGASLILWVAYVRLFLRSPKVTAD